MECQCFMIINEIGKETVLPSNTGCWRSNYSWCDIVHNTLKNCDQTKYRTFITNHNKTQK